MIFGFEVTSARRTADLAPSAVTSTCINCGKTIGASKGGSGRALWVTEGSGGTMCPQTGGSHLPKTASDGRVGGGDDWMEYNHAPSDHEPVCHDLGTFGKCETCGKATINEGSSNGQGPSGFKDKWVHVKAASLTVTAKEVGYYVCSRNGVPISGPYATRSDAAPNMIEQRGATVMFIGPGDSEEWAALKAKQFPYGLNSVNGSRKTAYDYEATEDQIAAADEEERARRGRGEPAKFRLPEDPTPEGPAWTTAHGSKQVTARELRCTKCEADMADEGNGDTYKDGVWGPCSYGGRHTPEWRPDRPRNHKASWETEEDPWAGEQHTAREHFFYTDEELRKLHPHLMNHFKPEETDGEEHTSARKHKFREDPNWGDETGCLVCGRTKGDEGHTDADKATGISGRGGSMQERYADGRRVASLRHFADDDEVGPEEDEWFKQPKGLTDQVDTGVAPTPEIQDPNPIAGQDLERIPRNLAEAAAMYATRFGWECPICKGQGCGSCGYTGQGHATDEPDGDESRQEQYDARRGGYLADRGEKADEMEDHPCPFCGSRKPCEHDY